MVKRWWLLVALTACDRGEDEDAGGRDTAAPESDPAPDTDPPVDTDVEPPPLGLQLPAQVLGVADLDDDDADGRRDALAPGFAANDDLVPLTITPSEGGRRAGLTTLDLRLEGAGVSVLDGGTVVLAEDGATTSWRWTKQPRDLQVVFTNTLADAVLVVAEKDAAGVTQTEARVVLRSAPLILNHHLQPAEEVWAVELDGIGGNNAAFISGFADALGARFTTVRGARYDYDVWFQDELEWATSIAPGQRLDLVIDSVRNRGLDPWPEQNIGGADEVSVVLGAGRASSQDSFGNLEVTPPVTVDGVTYPFGRIYYGAGARGYGPVAGLQQTLADQQVQAPFTLDTSWLCVGHVDEVMSFIPDPSAPKGWRLVWSDVDLAYELLSAMDPTTRLPRWAPSFSGHGIATVGELVNDAGIRAYNEDIRDEYLPAMLDVLRAEAGVEDTDILRIPALFEAARGCGGTAAALIPGMANLVVVNPPGGPVKLLMADPFLRADRDDPESDTVIQWMRSHFPGFELVFVDDWSTYHMALGEVHCGSNVRRTPQGEWWDNADADALLGRTP